MKNIYKKIMASIFVIIGLLGFSGCDFNFLNEVTNETLINGNYEITTYSINSVNNSEMLGLYATVNGTTLTDWDNNVATIIIEENEIELVWQSLTMIGTIANNVITLQTTVENDTYIIVLTYVEDAVLINGNYEVTTYSVNLVNNPEMLGLYATVNGTILTDWDNNVATLVIRGNSVELVFETGTMTGTIGNNAITLQTTVESGTYIIVLTYVS